MTSSTEFSNFISSTLTPQPDEPRLPVNIWIILIEVVYLIGFVCAAWFVRRFRWLKTDDDTLTRHHRVHASRIEKQKADLMIAQLSHENFIKASP